MRFATLGLLLLCIVAPSNGQERPAVVLTERAKQLHAESMLFDGHNDLPWAFRKLGMPPFTKVDIAKSQPDLHTDIDRLRTGGVKAQFWSVYVPSDTRLRGESLQTTMEQIDFVHRMVKHYPETFQLCLNAEDVEQAIAKGKIASLIGMEGGHSIENSINNLRRLHRLGARYMTLTHSATLAWADSATDEAKHGGLTPFGEEVVLEMNRLGMLVDLSHVSDETMRDALRVSRAPIIYSHSSARSRGDHVRNVPDDVLPLVRDNGGVIMVNFYSGYISPEAVAQRRKRDVYRKELEAAGQDATEVDQQLAAWDVKHPMARGSVHDVVDHIDHLVKHAGIDHVGIGSDYDGIGTVPRQLEDVSTYPVITQELLNRGYSEQSIHQILGKNVLRVLHEAEAVAKKMRAANE